MIAVTQSRGYLLLLILLTIPFCTPIPVPGFSTPFGLVIAFVGLRLALGQRPWLPARLLDIQLSAKLFRRILSAARRFARWVEFFARPRLGWILRQTPVRRGIGGAILICGLLLMLPMPILMTNSLPALTVLLFALAMLEDDAVLAMAGGGLFVLTSAFFAAVFWGGVEAAGHVRGWF